MMKSTDNPPQGTVFTSPAGDFALLPLHSFPGSPLQAWNAADTLLLKQCEALIPEELALEEKRVLLVNDSCGALAIGLHALKPVSWNDSHCSHLALQRNLHRNALAEDAVGWVHASELPEGSFDLVLIQIPKSLPLLTHQLTQLRPLLHEKSVVLGGAMVKHLSPAMIQCFESIIGPVQVSLAERKARTVRAQFDLALQPPAIHPTRYRIEQTPIELCNHPGVFSQSKLDIGTRFLLEHFPEVGQRQRIVDLGCGNGALGCFAGWRNPQAELLFVDESALAIESARASFANSSLRNTAHFLQSDGLDTPDSGNSRPVDLILCNPPFHAGNQMDSGIALRMFQQSAQHLHANGELVVVGNRHLDYHRSLKRWFRQVSLTASNRKFVVLSAKQPARKT